MSFADKIAGMIERALERRDRDGVPGSSIRGQIPGSLVAPATASAPGSLPAADGADGDVLTIVSGAWAPAAPGGGGGGAIDVTDGVTTVSSASVLEFTSGATVTNGGGGVAEVAISGGGGGDLVKIAEATPSGTGTVTFSSIPGTYRHLRVVAYGRTSGANDYVFLRINGDTGSNYDEGRLLNATFGQSMGQTRARIGIFPGSDSESGNAGGFEVVIPHYANTTFKKTGTSTGGGEKIDATAYQRIHTFWWRDTSAITALEFTVDGMNFEAGTVFSLYGVS